MKNKLYILLFLLCSAHVGAWDWWPLPMAQLDNGKDELVYVGELSGIGASGKTAPTWLQSNRFGEISSLPYSGNMRLGIVKPSTRPNRWYDYDGAVVLSGQIAGSQFGDKPQDFRGTGFFSDLHAHVRLYIVDITAGIVPISSGAGDPILSSGSLLFSRNAHAIPQISIGIDRWTAFPGLYGYLEIKGGLTHGWLDDNCSYVKKTLLHYKYIGGRVGGSLPINISYEFHHAAQWGGYSPTDGDLGNDWKAFKNVFLAKSGGTTVNEMFNAQGNHVISQILCLTAKGKDWTVDLYWQDIQEDGRFRFPGTGQNAADGLWGISFRQNGWPFISGVTFEVLQTTDQSGPWHDRDGLVFAGCDSYYSNHIYKQGWTYFGRTIGSPLMSPENNRVWAYHGGILGDIYGFRYRALVSYVDNYGTYKHPLKNHNTAVLLELRKYVPEAWGMEFGVALAGDFGTQYGNQFGGMITIRKQGLIKKW
ncbi:MAG: hypothetical protein IKT13_00800 [Paludibacteraceae bacterium]|nr:hypothetical protein [Paludibacteraceae bacterium]